MTTLRLVGIICAGLAAVVLFLRFRGGRIRRFDFGFGAFLSLLVLVVSIDPDAVNVLRDMLALEDAQFSRFMALLIVSSALLWLVVFSLRVRISAHAFQFDRLVRRLGLAEFETRYPERDRLPPVTVVIPAFDEEENIGAVLAAMPRTVCGREVVALVIDDGSADGTFGAARAAGALAVRSPLNRGGGAAIRLGFDIARAHGAEVVVTMDADGQHLPSEIERLVAPIVAGEADFVIGSRILGEREKDSFARLLGIHVFNAVIRFLTTARVTDCSNGFRAFRVSELSRLKFVQDQFHTSELIIEASRKGVRIREAPVTVRRRLSGASKKGRNWKYGLSFARTVLKTWWR